MTSSPSAERLCTASIYVDRPLSITPGSRIKTPLSDDAIWKRLKEAGFDEDSIKRRDKAALIAYIAKLESEIYDLQHQMGLLIMDKKDLASKNELIKASAETVEIMQKRDQTAHETALAAARKREESLKKALGIEKECIASIEKALHEMRAECAEAKVLSDNKLAEARSMVDEAQKKFIDAETKMYAAETSQAEASRYRTAAERKLQEVEAREDDLRRRMIAFKADCDAKEKEIKLERQSITSRQKGLQQEQERLVEGHALLTQREDFISNRSQELSQLEKDLEASKVNIEKQQRALNEKKMHVEQTVLSLSKREEAVVEREVILGRKEQDLLILQEKITSKASDEIKRNQEDHELVFRKRQIEFEFELERKRKLAEDEVEVKRRAWELREIDIKQHEDSLLERENDLEVQSRALAKKEKVIADKLILLQEKEKYINDATRAVELEKLILQNNKEELSKMKLDLERSFNSLEDKEQQVHSAKEKLETMKSETDELSVLEIKLKEEVDVVRAQKLELIAEAERLRVEKGKFEAEWEVLDEKREELRKEAEHVAEEKHALSKFLKDERDSLQLEKDSMRSQYKKDLELLNREREIFMSEMVQERTGLYAKLHQEHSEFLMGIEIQKSELETCIEKRKEEVECYLKDKEKAFEQERKNNLDYINSLKESVAKELDHISCELKKLEAERTEIKLDREQRDREWAELNTSIEELKTQRQKLKEQRESLHNERENIRAEIERLKTLEKLEVSLDYDAVSRMQQTNLETWKKLSVKRDSKKLTSLRDTTLDQQSLANASSNGHGLNSSRIGKSEDGYSPSTTHFSWIRRCKDMIFKSSPEKSVSDLSISGREEAGLISAGKMDSSSEYDEHKYASQHIFGEMQPIRHPLAEPKVILEVPSEIKEDSSRILAGRKRTITNLPSNDDVEPQPEQGQKNKKRRQQHNEAVNPSDMSFLYRGDDQCALASSNSTQEDAEGTTELVIDKIIQVTEMTSSKQNTEAIQREIGFLLNPLRESDHEPLNVGGTNRDASSGNSWDGVLPICSDVAGMLHGALQGDVEQQDCQFLEPDVIQRCGEQLAEDIGALVSEDV